jgi:hypothetical protein
MAAALANCMKPTELLIIEAVDLDAVLGGRGWRGFIEGVRNLTNAGMMALHLTNPTHIPPMKNIPNPPRIQRPIADPIQRRGAAGGDPTPPVSQ